MKGTFAGENDSPYFQSEAFGKVLQFIQTNPGEVRMNERKNKLTLQFDGVKSVKSGINYLMKLSK